MPLIRCDSDQVDTSSNVTHLLNNNNKKNIRKRVVTQRCLNAEPDTQKHLLHLPHTWSSLINLNV